MRTKVVEQISSKAPKRIHSLPTIVGQDEVADVKLGDRFEASVVAANTRKRVPGNACQGLNILRAARRADEAGERPSLVTGRWASGVWANSILRKRKPVPRGSHLGG